MTKEEQPERSIEDLFDEADLISRYTDDEAVADGILFPVSELAKRHQLIQWFGGRFQYITTNLCYTKAYFKDGEPVEPRAFLDLFHQVGLVMQREGPDRFYTAEINFPDGTTGQVYAVKNEHNRYTLLLPDDY